MNGKRFLILAAFAAFASIVMPAAFAGTVSNQANITIKWNTLAVGSMVLVADYNGTAQGGKTGNTTPAILTGNNGGIGTCTAAGGGVPANDTTADFSSVTADGTHATDCHYKNGFLTTITTSDPNGYTLGYAAVAGFPASGYNICAIHNGVWANNMAVTTSSAASATVNTNTASCTTGDEMNVAGTANAFTSGAGGNTAGTNLGGDIELVIGANAPTGASTVTEQFTLTLN